MSSAMSIENAPIMFRGISQVRLMHTHHSTSCMLFSWRAKP